VDAQTKIKDLRPWQRHGVWQKLYEVLLAELNEADRIDWSRALVDIASVRAPHGGAETGPNPTDRRKSGSKHHILTDAQGIPLATALTGAHRHDITQLRPLVDALPPVRGNHGRPRRRPQRLHGTEPTTPSRTAASCGAERSSRCWHGEALSMVVAWGCTGGTWNERCLGSINSAACGCAETS
jgi:transposase